VKHDESRPRPIDASALGVEVSPSALRRLGEFEALLRERAVPLGLVAQADAPRIQERHIFDSLRAVAVVRDADALAYDIGSGAGLPGLVIAVARPRLRMVLVEPRRRAAAFLELAVERLEATNASVYVGGVEDLVEAADLCFARAYAPLPHAWRAALPRLRPGGRLVYFSGAHSETPVVPEGATDLQILETPVLESAGSLIIMAR